MPQSPIAVYSQYLGGNNSALNVTGVKVIKGSPGTLYRIHVIAPGSAGSLVINDNVATGGSNTAANTIASIGFANLTAGQVITLDWPCLNGITVSAVPSAGSPIFSISYS